MAKFSSVQSEIVTENINGFLALVFLLLFPSWGWRWVEVSAWYRCPKQRCKQPLADFGYLGCIYPLDDRAGSCNAFKAALRGKTCSWPFYKLHQPMLTKDLFISCVFISVSICLPAYLLSLSFYLYFISFPNWNSSLPSCCVDNGWLLNCDDPLLIQELPWITNWLPWHINQVFKSPLQGW